MLLIFESVGRMFESRRAGHPFARVIATKEYPSLLLPLSSTIILHLSLRARSSTGESAPAALLLKAIATANKPSRTSSNSDQCSQAFRRGLKNLFFSIPAFSHNTPSNNQKSSLKANASFLKAKLRP
jgi:hypothetical protein